MHKINLTDAGTKFEALLLNADRPTRLVLFAAGSGGNPERHLALLNSLVENSCTVIAPYFEQLVSPAPNASDLVLRTRRLQIAFDQIADPNLPVVGIGHSIGATLLLAMAGGEMWMRAGERLPIKGEKRLKKLVLFTPPTGFFQAPNALSAIQIPLQAWAGTLDSITPQNQIEFLKNKLPTQVSFDLHIIEGAGHFSFMNTLPPQMNDSMENREDFLKSLAVDVCRFTLA
jgi:pimeloyl-ACP methyl ester carboxylesterase